MVVANSLEMWRYKSDMFAANRTVIELESLRLSGVVVGLPVFLGKPRLCGSRSVCHPPWCQFGLPQGPVSEFHLFCTSLMDGLVSGRPSAGILTFVWSPRVQRSSSGRITRLVL